MKNSIVILVILVFLVVATGCTQSPTLVKPTESLTPTPALTQVATVTAKLTLQKTPSVSDNTIWIKKSGFDPVTITVKSGSTVRWVNADSTANPALYNPTHRIAVVNIAESPLLSPGQGWSWIFDQSGSYDYSDMLHPDLEGTVIVV
ncbi:MAG: cupredoxin domain-containing protein [Methanoregula sp.]|nr:cupredoxin domain-containing protein [Methanoregula sp.]